MFYKSLLSVAVIAATMSVANAATVYNSESAKLAVGGRVAANLNSVFADNGASKSCDSGDKDECKVKLAGSARLHIDAESSITKDISAIAFAEWQVGATSSDNGKFDTRYAYVGLKSDSYGQVVFGQREDAFYNALSGTDIFVDYGFSTTDAGTRNEGLVVYEHAIKQFDFAVSYETESSKVNSGLAGAIGYTISEELPMRLSLGYETVDGVKKKGQASYDSVGFGVSYGSTSSGLYLAASFAKTDVDGSSAGIDSCEAVAAYSFDNGLAVMGGLEYAEIDNDTVISDLVAEVKYYLNDNVYTYAEAQIGLSDIDATKERSHDKLSVGLHYNF